jgi:hypothetical protein
VPNSGVIIAVGIEGGRRTILFGLSLLARELKAEFL